MTLCAHMATLGQIDKLPEMIHLILASSSFKLDGKQEKLFHEVVERECTDRLTFTKRVNFKLRHGQAVFKFASDFAQNKSLQPHLHMFVQSVIHMSKQLPVGDSYTALYAALALILEKVEIDALLSDVIVPSVQRIADPTSDNRDIGVIDAFNERENKIVTLVAASQCTALLTSENDSDFRSHFAHNLLWNFLLKDVLFLSDIIFSSSFFTRSSDEQQKISELMANHTSDAMFVVRFFVINAVAACCAKDAELAHTMISECRSYSSRLNNLWYRYTTLVETQQQELAGQENRRQKQKQKSHAKLTLHQSKAIQNLMHCIADCISILLGKMLGATDDKEEQVPVSDIQPSSVVEIVHTIADCEFIKQGNANLEKLLRSTADRLSSISTTNPELVDACIPTSHHAEMFTPQQSNVVVLSKAHFYLGFAKRLLPHFTQDALVHQVVPFMFNMLQSGNPVIVQQAHKLLQSFFIVRHPLCGQLIPFFIKLGLNANNNGQAVMHSLFCDSFPKLLSTVVSLDEEGTSITVGWNSAQDSSHSQQQNHALISYCANVLAEAICQQLDNASSNVKDNVELGRRHEIMKKQVQHREQHEHHAIAARYFAIMISLTQTVPLRLLPVVFDSISTIFGQRSIPDTLKLSLYKSLFTAFSNSMDYTRKQKCIEFYLQELSRARSRTASSRDNNSSVPWSESSAIST